MYHGMLTVYKEKGYTSSDAVARLRGILRMRKIGHTGTLDPDAEGVLPMCLGNATRICELIADREKEYQTVMRLGVRTDTQDMGGTVLSSIEEEKILPLILAGKEAESAGEAEAGISRTEGILETEKDREAVSLTGDPEDRDLSAAKQRIRKTAALFLGEIEQIPPMYSAIKVNGRRLYDMARKGITVERKPRRITIYEISVEKIELPLVALRIRCSRGTYIRTLCEDIGNALGTGAAMQSLLRTQVGSFTLSEALTLDEIERIAKTQPERLPGLIRPVDSFFGGLPAAVCAEDALRLLRNGNPLSKGQLHFVSRQAENAKQSFSGVPAEAAAQAFVREKGSGEEGFLEHLQQDSSSLEEKTDPEAIRVYDESGVFYGLYRKRSGPEGYAAWKMFLPEAER